MEKNVIYLYPNAGTGKLKPKLADVLDIFYEERI